MMASLPESSGTPINVAASMRAKLKQGASAVEKAAWNPMVTDEDRRMLAMGMEQREPIVIDALELLERVIAVSAPAVVAPMVKNDRPKAKVVEGRGWKVAGWLVVIVLVAGAVGTWASVNRYEVVKKKADSAELLYRVDHWTGAVEPVNYGIK